MAKNKPLNLHVFLSCGGENEIFWGFERVIKVGFQTSDNFFYFYSNIDLVYIMKQVLYSEYDGDETMLNKIDALELHVHDDYRQLFGLPAPYRPTIYLCDHIHDHDHDH